MKKLMIRIIAVMLLAVIIVTAASCSEPDDGPTSDTGEDTTSGKDIITGVTTDPNVDDDGYLLDNIPDDLNYDNAKINFLVWSDVENSEFEIESATQDPVDDAIFYRNLEVENRLGVELNFDSTPGNRENTSAFMQQARARIQSNSSDSLDIMAAYSLTTATLSYNGLCANLNGLEYLDFSQPWWPERLISEATVDEKIYFCSGDLSTNMLHMMHAVFFNKDMMVDYGQDPDELYADVLNQKWTIDQMLTLAALVYDDLDTSQTKSTGDRFGLVICDNYYDSFFYAAGMTLIDHTDSGIEISDDLASEKAVDLVSKVGDFFNNNNSGFMITDFSEGEYMYTSRALMVISRCHIAYKQLKNYADLNYGQLPFPKYNAEQKDYVSVLAFPCTLYAVSATAEDIERAGAVLEVMCSEGYRQITPVLFEVSMKVKYSTDEEASQIYDIIRSTVTFDLGRMYHDELGEMIKYFRNACSANDSGYGARVNANLTASKLRLDSLLTKLQ